jgi:ABC-type amino acid transport substrate-binding protein
MGCIKILLLALLVSCSQADNQKKIVRISIDPNWTSLNLYGQEKNVNAFLNELLVEQANEQGVLFLRINANWDPLLDDLRMGRTHAALSSLPLYNFNEARFDFSDPILELGPILIVPKNSGFKTLREFSNRRIGVLVEEQSAPFLQQISDLMIHSYPTVEALLNAIVRGELEGGVLDSLLAISYVGGIYKDRLKIEGSPLSDVAIRLVVLKGKERTLLARFNKGLAAKKLQPLLKKWALS